MSNLYEKFLQTDWEKVIGVCFGKRKMYWTDGFRGVRTKEDDYSISLYDKKFLLEGYALIVTRYCSKHAEDWFLYAIDIALNKVIVDRFRIWNGKVDGKIINGKLEVSIYDRGKNTMKETFFLAKGSRE